MGVYVGDDLVAGNVGEVYSKAQVDAMIANAVALAEPTGSIKPFAGTTIPDGYLLCDGSAVSRTTYAALFAVIGTTYGTGDGSTTFNLPDYTERTLWQNANATRGVNYTGRVPNITGYIHSMFTAMSSASTLNLSDINVNGCFEPTGAWNRVTPSYQSTTWYIDGVAKLNASNSSSTYGRAHQAGDDNSVIPRSLSCVFCIKY